MNAWRTLGASSAVAALLTFGLIGSALADGGPRRGKVVQECCIDWGGLYFGAHVGYMWSDISGVSIATPDPLPTVNQDDAVAGIQIGIQHQFGNVVLGVEAGLTSTLGRFNHYEPLPTLPGLSAGARLDNILYVGPRLGWAAGNWMPYVTGGYAAGAVESRSIETVGGATVVKARERHDGWYIGAGVDWACCGIGDPGIRSNWTLGIEYRHYEFEDAVHITATTIGRLIPRSRHSVDLDADVIAVRLSYKIRRAAQPLK